MKNIKYKISNISTRVLKDYSFFCQQFDILSGEFLKALSECISIYTAMREVQRVI